MQTPIEYPSTSDTATSHRSFSPAVCYGNMIFVSGLASVDKEGRIVRDAADTPQFQELYREYFKAPYPVRTRIINCLPEILKYEAECVAVRKPS